MDSHEARYLSMRIGVALYTFRSVLEGHRPNEMWIGTKGKELHFHGSRKAHGDP